MTESERAAVAPKAAASPSLATQAQFEAEKWYAVQDVKYAQKVGTLTVGSSYQPTLVTNNASVLNCNASSLVSR